MNSRQARIKRGRALLIITLSLVLFLTGTILGCTVSPWFFIFSAIGLVSTTGAAIGFFNTTKRQLSNEVSEIMDRGVSVLNNIKKFDYEELELKELN
jgi:hypothetical protein